MGYVIGNFSGGYMRKTTYKSKQAQKTYGFNKKYKKLHVSIYLPIQ